MARDEDSIRERKRKREEEDSRDHKLKESVKGKAQPKGQNASSTTSSEPSLHQLLEKVSSMTEQVDHLYQQYIQGLEKKPPVELRKQLENHIDQLKKTPASSNSLTQFQVQNQLSKFQTYRERWDKFLKDIESGKIKRSVGSGGKL